MSCPFLSHFNIPLSYSLFIQISYGKFLFSPQNRRIEKRPLDSSPAAVVIDRDVAVFILKLLDKTNSH